MDLERTFITLTPERLSKMIMDARWRVIYAAPSLTMDVATALIHSRDRLGAASVVIVLDVTEGVLRLGYGLADALSILKENNVSIRDARGLRISFIVVDDDGFVFALLPMLVEDNTADDHPNAVRVSRDQIERLVQAVLPATSSDGSSSSSLAKAPALTPPFLQCAEIGLAMASPMQITKIEQAIKANPVENFDLKRIVNVFSPYFQFYELEIINTHIERRTAKLPKEILASIRDKATLDRISAAFKMLSNDSKLSGENIHKKAQEIRKRFLRHHPIYGGVVLKSDQAALDASIRELEQLVTDHRKSVAARFDQDVKNSIDKIVQAFWRNVSRNPPQELLNQGIVKPTMEQAKNYLRRKLLSVLPDARELVEKMQIKVVVKDITWNALNEKDFVEWLRKQWPDRTDLQQPFDEYRAAASARMSGSGRRRW